MPTKPHPITYRKPALVHTIAGLLIRYGPQERAALITRLAEEDHTTEKTAKATLDDLLRLGAVGYMMRPAGVIRLTDLGRLWITDDLDTLPTPATDDGEAYHWNTPDPDHEPDPTR